MNHTTSLFTILAAGCCVALAACSNSSQSGDSNDAISPNAGDSSSTEAALPDVSIPTQEEADALAAREITATNADDEFEALMKEIESETDE